MKVPESAATFPPSYSIDYDSVLAIARVEGGADVPLFLRQYLPSKWHDLYLATVARPTNIVRLRSGSFEYFYDVYSELEITGEVPTTKPSRIELLSRSERRHLATRHTRRDGHGSAWEQRKIFSERIATQDISSLTASVAILMEMFFRSTVTSTGDGLLKGKPFG